MAKTAAPTRSGTPSLAMMADTCDLMVASLRFSRLAICLLVRASLMSARTSS